MVDTKQLITKEKKIETGGNTKSVRAVVDTGGGSPRYNIYGEVIKQISNNDFVNKDLIRFSNMEFAECSIVKDFQKIYVEKKQKKSVIMILLKRTLQKS
jgi:hypothetical protein